MDNLNMNIGTALNPNWIAINFIKEYFNQNKDNLRQFKTKKGNKCTLVASTDGWCTVVWEKTEMISQLWAGELILI